MTKNEKITVTCSTSNVLLAILMWFPFKWIDNSNGFLNGLNYTSLF